MQTTFNESREVLILEFRRMMQEAATDVVLPLSQEDVGISSYGISKNHTSISFCMPFMVLKHAGFFFVFFKLCAFGEKQKKKVYLLGHPSTHE